MAKKYDDFDDGDQGGMFDQIFGIISQHRKAFAVTSVAAAVLVLGLIVWDSYPSNNEDAATESVPIVRADSGDYKTAPENPGGMEVPYRDSTVFSSNDGEATENILADSTEEPVSKDTAFAGLKTEENTAPAETAPAGDDVAMDKVEPVLPPANNEALVKEAIGTTAPVTEEEAPVAVTEEKPAPVEEPKTVATKEIESAPAKTEPAAGTTAAKVTAGGSYVQLASVKDPSGAASEYKKMQVKYSALSGVDYRTQKADLGAKGTFYRIQAGPMSKDSATSVCNAIKAKGGSCLIVTK